MDRLDELLQVFRTSDDADQLEAARRAMAREADATWLLRLVEALTAPGDALLREAAALPVIRLAGAAALPHLLRAHFLARDEEEEDDAIDAALVGFVEAQPAAVEPFLRAWLGSPDVRERAAAARLWGCADLALDPLLGAAQDAAPDVRRAAVGSLSAHASDARALEAVVALTRDDDPAVRVAAALALSAFESPAATRRLRELRDDPDDRVRAVASCWVRDE